MAPFRTNFVEAARTFVRGMFVPTSDATLIEDIVAKMLTAPSNIGISAAEENWGNDQNLQEGLKEINAPIFLINSAQRPPFTNMEVAQAHGIEVTLMSGVGHFVMMEDVETFNRLLDEAVKECVRARELS